MLVFLPVFHSRCVISPRICRLQEGLVTHMKGSWCLPGLRGRTGVRGGGALAVWRPQGRSKDPGFLLGPHALRELQGTAVGGDPVSVVSHCATRPSSRSEGRGNIHIVLVSK